ncbi:unnamed protein product [Trichobilharzia regenti]|nr:unnamed protein product [Trichobilharzia regenti]
MLNDTEIALCCTAVITKPNRYGLMEPNKVAVIQDHHLAALRMQLERNRSREPALFGQVRNVISQVATVGDEVQLCMRWYRENWYRTRLAPLYAETYDIPHEETSTPAMPPQAAGTGAQHTGNSYSVCPDLVSVCPQPIPYGEVTNSNITYGSSSSSSSAVPVPQAVHHHYPNQPLNNRPDIPIMVPGSINNENMTYAGNDRIQGVGVDQCASDSQMHVVNHKQNIQHQIHHHQQQQQQQHTAHLTPDSSHHLRSSYSSSTSSTSLSNNSDSSSVNQSRGFTGQFSYHDTAMNFNPSNSNPYSNSRECSPSSTQTVSTNYLAPSPQQQPPQQHQRIQTPISALQSSPQFSCPGTLTSSQRQIVSSTISSTGLSSLQNQSDHMQMNESIMSVNSRNSRSNTPTGYNNNNNNNNNSNTNATTNSNLSHPSSTNDGLQPMWINMTTNGTNNNNSNNNNNNNDHIVNYKSEASDLHQHSQLQQQRTTTTSPISQSDLLSSTPDTSQNINSLTSPINENNNCEHQET